MALAPTLSTLRTAIADAVKLALNPGMPANVLVVHDKRVFWRDAAKFRSLSLRKAPDVVDDVYNMWMVYRVATRVIETPERFRFYGIHKFHLDGYYAVTDDNDSQKTFADQIEAIRDEIRLTTAIFGDMEKVLPDTQVESDADPVGIGNITAWHAILSLEAEGIEVKSLP